MIKCDCLLGAMSNNKEHHPLCVVVRERFEQPRTIDKQGYVIMVNWSAKGREGGREYHVSVYKQHIGDYVITGRKMAQLRRGRSIKVGAKDTSTLGTSGMQ